MSPGTNEASYRLMSCAVNSLVNTILRYFPRGETRFAAIRTQHKRQKSHTCTLAY